MAVDGALAVACAVAAERAARRFVEGGDGHLDIRGRVGVAGGRDAAILVLLRVLPRFLAGDFVAEEVKKSFEDYFLPCDELHVSLCL